MSLGRIQMDKKASTQKVKRTSTKREQIASHRLHELTKHLFYTKDYGNVIDKYYYLESQWTDVIDEGVYMTNKEKLQQRAIWEFLVTEKNYIKKLRVIVEVFQQSFKLIQGEGELQDVEENAVFGNIRDVFMANDSFWTNHLVKVLEETRRTRKPIVPSHLLQCLRQVEQTFEPYMHFCCVQEKLLENLRCVLEQADSKNDNINFKSWLIWCQKLPQCERRNLADLMTETMQRLTRYPLLLKKIYGETVDEEEKGILETMVKSAENFAYNVNKAIRTQDEKIKLDFILKDFEQYSVMDAGCEEVKWIAIDFLRLNVQGLSVEEPRCILMEGPMKMIERKGKNEMSIKVLLFTDLIALARYKKSTAKLTVIRQLYFLDKVKIVKSETQSNAIVFLYLDEAGLLATTFVLELHNQEQSRHQDRDTWISTIQKAKKIYERARDGKGSTFENFEDENVSKPDDEIKPIKRPLYAKSNSLPNHTLSGCDHLYHSNIPLDEETKENYLPYRTIPDDKTANWVLTNKDRTSVASDVSSECRCPGTSFKSNKSDGDIIYSGSDSGVSIRSSNSVPELPNINKFKRRLTGGVTFGSWENDDDRIRNQHDLHNKIGDIRIFEDLTTSHQKLRDYSNQNEIVGAKLDKGEHKQRVGLPYEKHSDCVDKNENVAVKLGTIKHKQRVPLPCDTNKTVQVDKQTQT